MNFELMVIFSLSILPVAIAAISKWKSADAVFYPIMVCIFAGLVNEVISIIIIYNGYSNAINVNIYYAIEALLVLEQFRRWGLFDSYNRSYPVYKSF